MRYNKIKEKKQNAKFLENRILYCNVNKIQGVIFVKEKQCFRQFSTWSISRGAYLVLSIGLPVVVLELLFLLFSFLRDRAYNAVFALYYYPMMLEYILMSFTLVIIGAFLFDYVSAQK